MIRYILTALALIASPAIAQTWQAGPQTPSYPGGALAEYTGVVGDGSTTQGGTPPVAEPADIASTGITVADWITNTSIVRTSSVGGEDKMRLLCTASHTKREDPILFPGVANAGHDHTFIGNMSAGKDSTYASLRADSRSTCPGGPVNGTAYWEPSLMTLLPTGATVEVKPDRLAFYYTHSAVDSPKKTRLFNGLAFILGVNPGDPDDLVRKAEVPAGFTYIGNGFVGWQCTNLNGDTTIAPDAGGTHYPALQTPAGADPWGGRCNTGKVLLAEAHAPTCWDGRNITSPNGRDHFRYTILHNNSGKFVCPTGWWQVPAFEVKVIFSHKGWSDYQNWYLSSDRHGLTSGDWRTPGSTYHADWMNGWDPTILDTALVNCMGVKIGATAGNGATCDYSTISATQRLLSDSASPDPTKSNDPIVTINNNYAAGAKKNRYFPVRAGTKGPFTIHSH